jgi:hypothetical protein
MKLKTNVKIINCHYIFFIYVFFFFFLYVKDNLFFESDIPNNTISTQDCVI